MSSQEVSQKSEKWYMGFYYQKTLEGWLIFFVSKIFPLRILRNSVCGSTLIRMVICNVCMWFLRFKLINLKSRVRLDLLVTHMRRNTDWMHSPVRLKKKKTSFHSHHTLVIPPFTHEPSRALSLKILLHRVAFPLESKSSHYHRLDTVPIPSLPCFTLGDCH